MRTLPAHVVLLGALGATLAGACDSELALILTGKRCRLDRDPPCLDRYVCIEGYCRLPEDVVVEDPEDAGVGGSSTASDDGGEVSGGTGGTPALGGAGSHGGTGPIVDIPDASIILDGGADGCVPVDLYRDNDGDGYGDTAQRAFGCIRDGWVEAFDDCRDDVFNVHPGQTEAFGEGYLAPGKPDGISFDYDCDDVETPGANTPSGVAPGCQALLGLDCITASGSGYDMTGRSGAGINALCGSETVVSCAMNGGQCVPQPIPVQEPFKCR